MQLHELKNSSCFSSKTNSNRKNKMYIREVLNRMKNYYQDIKLEVDDFDNKSEREQHVILGFISNTFNKYTQCFMDVMDVILAKSGKQLPDITLRYYCRQCLFMFDSLSASGSEMVAYLVAHNEIVHDYMNDTTIEQEEFNKFYNYVDGLLDIVVELTGYATDNGLMEVEIR